VAKRPSDEDRHSGNGGTALKPQTERRSRQGSLEQTIEGEIIPRLMLALKNAARADGGTATHIFPTQECIRALADLAIGPDPTAGQRYVETLRGRGMDLECIYLHLLAPAARYLGDMWDEDLCDFNDVSIALSRLHGIMRQLGPQFRAGSNTHSTGTYSGLISRGRALLLPMPGEHHTFGCVMIEDFFTRAGWEVTGWPLSADEDLVETVRHGYFDLVGLSVSLETSLPLLEQQIKDMRRASCNRSLIVLAGGRAFADAPELAVALGADATGKNGRDAVLAADAAMCRLAERT
jgi:MerR family transcriptional regulator, light-induced transcriptional regulator